jgi:hypothetical protein
VTATRRAGQFSPRELHPESVIYWQKRWSRLQATYGTDEQWMIMASNGNENVIIANTPSPEEISVRYYFYISRERGAIFIDRLMRIRIACSYGLLALEISHQVFCFDLFELEKWHRRSVDEDSELEDQ